MKTDIAETREFCEICHVGSLRPYRATYVRWHGGKFAIVSAVPAWRCDFCGDAFYDDEALARLVLLLGSESHSGDRQRRRGLGPEGRLRSGFGDRRRIG